MDPQRFAALSRRFAADASRRGVLRAASGLAAGALTFGRFGTAGATDAEGIPIVNCKAPGKKCDHNGQDQNCCSTKCRKNRCTCAKKGRPCWTPLEGALCCSQKCDHGKCA
jgi:hypothetical protein